MRFQIMALVTILSAGSIAFAGGGGGFYEVIESEQVLNCSSKAILESWPVSDPGQGSIKIVRERRGYEEGETATVFTLIVKHPRGTEFRFESNKKESLTGSFDSLVGYLRDDGDGITTLTSATVQGEIVAGKPGLLQAVDSDGRVLISTKTEVCIAN